MLLMSKRVVCINWCYLLTRTYNWHASQIILEQLTLFMYIITIIYTDNHWLRIYAFFQIIFQIWYQAKHRGTADHQIYHYKLSTLSNTTISQSVLVQIMAWRRWQAIVQSNYGPYYWCIYASLTVLMSRMYKHRLQAEIKCEINIYNVAGRHSFLHCDTL